MTSEWPLVALEELVDPKRPITYGVVKPGVHDPCGIRFVRGGDISNGRIALDQLRTITQSVSNQYKRTLLEGGELLVSLVGNPGEVAIAPPSLRGANIARQVGMVCLGDTVEPRYVQYFLTSPIGKRALGAKSLGSVQTVINLRDLKRVELPIPDRATQRAIAMTLGAIDDRIDNLRQTNTTLEAIAQALFKSWFVNFDPVHAKAEGRTPEAMDAVTATLFPSEFEQSELGLIPKGWHAGRLGDISTNLRDKAKPGEIDPDTPYLGLEHMPRKSIALSNHGTADGLGSDKFWFEKSDILFGKLRPYFHKVGLAPFKGICSTDILVLRPLKSIFHALLLTHASSDAIIDYATRLSNGAKMPRSSWKDIANYPICVPPDSIAQAFNELIDPMFERIKENVQASSTLGELRDTLLPRLIAGKLRLPEVRKLAEVEA